jgi:pimeloyl-ACP methyl ester carboxylesterase
MEMLVSRTVAAKYGNFAVLISFLLICGLNRELSAQVRARIQVAGSSAAPQSAAGQAAIRPPQASAVAGCPNQGGILDSISVPVGQPLTLEVVTNAPAPAGGALFEIASDNPAYVAAGDKVQGFLPIVTIPEGGTISNPFTIFGISVGQTSLELIGLTPGYGSGAFPLGAWDVNRSGAAIDQKFLDAIDPANACLDPGASSLTTNPALEATCGTTVQGVASDGVNALLLRTLSGLTGTACFEIVSTSSLDQGTIATPLTSTQPASSLNYGFSYYTPPSYYGDTSSSRPITVQFTFTPDIGNGNTTTLQAQTQIVRPPVMLIHGVWSNAGNWGNNFLKRSNIIYTAFAADYAGTNAASFSTNQGRVQGFVASTLALSRKKHYAATQVDVIAHSMGGLLTRLYAGSQNFARPDNLNMGDVHRLITLDTPHFGSNFANLLTELHQVNPTHTESVVSNLTGGSVTGGAVCDLSENSPALAGLAGGTALTAQAITATGGPAQDSSKPYYPGYPYWSGATFLHLKSFESALTDQYCSNFVIGPNGQPLCTSYQYYFPQTTVDAYRFRQANDAVVPLSSQQGGLGGINYTAYIHFHIPGIPGVQRGITDGTDVSTQAFQLLDGPSSGFASALPAVQSNGSGAALTVPGITPIHYFNQCGSGQSMKTNVVKGKQPVTAAQSGAKPRVADPRVNLISPAAGATFHQGDTITMVIALTPPLTAGNTVGVGIAGLTHVPATWTSGLQFTATFTIPELVAGALTLSPDFTDTQGNDYVGAPVTVGVQPPVPTSLSFSTHNYFVAPGDPSQQLYLSGTLADGTGLDLSAGFASVTGRNGGLSDVTTFLVEDPANPLPPVSLKSQAKVVSSGYSLNRNTGFFVQTITVTNTSPNPLPGNLYLVFSGLTGGVSLVNQSGLTQALAPAGSPYLQIPLPGEGLTLPPGNSVQFVLQFLNANRVGINYSLDLLRTSVAP